MSKEIDFGSEMQELANVVAQYAPENWEKMTVQFEFYSDGDYGIESRADCADGKYPVDFDEEDIDALEKTFKSIRKKSIERWNISHFEFNNEGDCEINFEY